MVSILFRCEWLVKGTFCVYALPAKFEKNRRDLVQKILWLPEARARLSDLIRCSMQLQTLDGGWSYVGLAFNAAEVEPQLSYTELQHIFSERYLGSLSHL